ncbi:MAG: iron-containing alcohol dehydrogenase [Bacteroidales bacterium]|nr:iron-containing alcohol dehydrogenase [Bacteroidales bacterium]MDD3910699.1 iron-containing alcohol dehydrogenase [Bacteroidales bacterium]MDD4420065.1 iron-containing alcohol dehydrogenase [Bacteroidales bacterium]
MNKFDMYVPTRLVFGQGQLNNLHTLPLPGKKALIVISNGKSTRANGYLDRTQEQLKMADVEYVVFDKVEPNPLKSTVEAGGKMARENKCDFILPLGGGSCMDAAKGIAAMATNDGDLWDYIAFGTGKGKPIINPLPIVAISTTAGTGSETDNGAVITNPETKEKTALFGVNLFPVLAIVDPELMASVPPKLTAYQGFDAIFHSLEGYVSKFANLMSDMYAHTAIYNVSHYLPRAVKNGKDMEARDKVAFANSLSGTVMCVGTCTAEHSLEHALSAYHQELPHGAGLIMISKAYYSCLIRKHSCDERFVQMAKIMGMENASKPEDFITTLVKLQEGCGVADLKMSDYGIRESEFEGMVKNAKSCMSMLFDCERLPLTDEDCIRIYRESYK